MLRTIKNKVAKMEDYLGRGRGAIIVIVEPGQTPEEALELHYRERPQDIDPPGVLFIKRTIGSKAMREREAKSGLY